MTSASSGRKPTANPQTDTKSAGVGTSGQDRPRPEGTEDTEEQVIPMEWREPSHTMKFPEPPEGFGENAEASLLVVSQEGRCENCGHKVGVRFDLGQLVVKLFGFSKKEPTP